LTSIWPKLATTLTTPDSIFNFGHCISIRADIPHEYRAEGILMAYPTVAMSREPGFVALVDAPAADPANDDYGTVVKTFPPSPSGLGSRKAINECFRLIDHEDESEK
jgi:hypothetical protein